MACKASRGSGRLAGRPGPVLAACWDLVFNSERREGSGLEASALGRLLHSGLCQCQSSPLLSVWLIQTSGCVGRRMYGVVLLDPGGGSILHFKNVPGLQGKLPHCRPQAARENREGCLNCLPTQESVEDGGSVVLHLNSYYFDGFNK